MHNRIKRRAFTLIEILIVVVILGILAAIVIPQFTEASDDAAVSSAKSTLQTVRAQLELYKFKNAGYPPAVAGTAPNGDMPVVLWTPNAAVDPNSYLQQEPVGPGGYNFLYTAATGAFIARDANGTPANVDTGW